MCCFCKISIGKEEWRREIVNGSRSFFGLKRSNARNSIQSSSWCWGDSGFVSSEDVFETSPGEVHTTSSGSQSEVKPPSAQLEMGGWWSRTVGRAETVLLWGPVGWQSWVFNCLWLFISNELQNWANHLLITFAKTITKSEVNMILNLHDLGDSIFHTIYMSQFSLRVRTEFWNALELEQLIDTVTIFNVRMDCNQPNPTVLCDTDVKNIKLL